jgi:hypothetical protein
MNYFSENRTPTSGSVARNSDHQTTEVVMHIDHFTALGQEVAYLVEELCYKPEGRGFDS